jgi:hypothetical protein
MPRHRPLGGGRQARSASGRGRPLGPLAALISALPKGSATPQDSGTIAARLITLLPRRSEREIAAQRAPSGGPSVIRIPNRATILARAVLCLIILALLLLSQWVVVSHPASLPVKKPLAAPAMVVPAEPRHVIVFLGRSRTHWWLHCPQDRHPARASSSTPRGHSWLCGSIMCSIWAL